MPKDCCIWHECDKVNFNWLITRRAYRLEKNTLLTWGQVLMTGEQSYEHYFVRVSGNILTSYYEFKSPQMSATIDNRMAFNNACIMSVCYSSCWLTQQLLFVSNLCFVSRHDHFSLLSVFLTLCHKSVPGPIEQLCNT